MHGRRRSMEVVDLQVLLGALLIGAGVGFLSGAFGKGGSAVSTPLLHALGVPAIVAIASPLPATIPSTLLASRGYARAGHVDRARAAHRPDRRPPAHRARRVAHPLDPRRAARARDRRRSSSCSACACCSARTTRRRRRRGRRPPRRPDRAPSAVVAVAGVVSGPARQQRRLPPRAAVHERAAHARAPRARNVARARGRARGAGHDRARVARPHRLVADAGVRARVGAARDPRRDGRAARARALADAGVRRRHRDARRAACSRSPAERLRPCRIAAQPLATSGVAARDAIRSSAPCCGADEHVARPRRRSGSRRARRRCRRRAPRAAAARRRRSSRRRTRTPARPASRASSRARRASRPSR